MTAKRPAPQRDGWAIIGVGDQWKAVRTETLNAWQLAYGCHGVVFANSQAELEILLTAEKVKDDMIDLAARLAAGMREAAK